MNDDILKKLLKKIVKEFVIIDPDKLVDILFKKKNVNEFNIAKKLSLTINQTRNILYKLGDDGLVSFIRKKDNKKGGWYTYFWTLETKKGLEKYKEKIHQEIQEQYKQLKIREIEKYYFCKNCNLEFNEENALLNNYTCPECGETLEIKEQTEIINRINLDIKKLEDNLNNIQQELDLINAKDKKTKDKKIKEEIKLKALEKEKKKKAREREKKKLLKSGAGAKEKKSAKKKVSKKKKK